MSDLVAAVAVTAIFAALAYALGMVSVGGALGGFAVGSIIYAGLGPQGFVVLALFVIGGSALTRLGYALKHHAGTAQERGGRRGAKNALANCAVATACAILAAATDTPALTAAFVAAFVASVGAAFADTAESEVGQLYGHAPRLITTLRKVPPGTNGAVSLPGTLAGIAATLLTAALGLALGLVDGPVVVLAVVFAAFLGTVADSLVGALAPRLGNEATNVVCTLVAAVLAFFIA